MVVRGLDDAGDTDEAIRANATCHDVMVELSGSRLIASVLEPVAEQLRWLLRQHTDCARIYAEHVAISDALRDRDPERAAALCADHLASSRVEFERTRRAAGL